MHIPCRPHAVAKLNLGHAPQLIDLARDVVDLDDQVRPGLGLQLRSWISHHGISVKRLYVEINSQQEDKLWLLGNLFSPRNSTLELSPPMLIASIHLHNKPTIKLRMWIMSGEPS